MPPSLNSEIAVVVIGRNEGERLVACLGSVLGDAARVIYVDSGSVDGSPDRASEAGAEVVDLDMSVPFTAARARNAGLALVAGEQTPLVQFVDGDCIVEPGWLGAAERFLAEHPEVGVVCGRRREMHPEVSVYNRLCNREWDTPVGPASACGGDAMMRVAALRAVGGFRDGLIAGEEPELCLRLARAGWGIWRLDAPMTRHDAAITRFSQWWRRTRRAGHAFAEGAYLHGAGPERHWVRETRSGLFWGAALPLVLLLAALASPAALWGFAVYPAQVVRLWRRLGGDRGAAEAALFLVLGKFAEAQGVIEFHLRRWSGRRRGLVEYK